MSITRAVNCRTPLTPCPATLRDVSVSGCLIEVEADVAIGTTVFLDLDEEGMIPGEILRRSGSSLAIVFHWTLATERIDALARGLGEARFDLVFRDRFGRPLPPLVRIRGR